MSSKGLEGNPAVTGEIFTKDCPYVKKGGKAVKDFWEPIEQHHNEYLKYLKDADYHDVDFNWNGGMKATHKYHNIDKIGGVYERHVQNAGFKTGNAVILECERGKMDNERYVEGTWNGLKFEIAGRETATINNILKGLKHCAAKRETEIAVLDFPNEGFTEENFKQAVLRYRGLEKLNDGQFLKFKKIICVQNENIVYETDF